MMSWFPSGPVGDKRQVKKKGSHLTVNCHMTDTVMKKGDASPGNPSGKSLDDFRKGAFGTPEDWQNVPGAKTGQYYLKL